MKEEVKETTNINFDLIRGWISEHLKTPNDIVHSEGRKVIVNTEIGLKEFTIPKLSEDNKEEWKQVWFDVYEACLDALQLKVNRIYVVGRKEGYIVQSSPNEVRVGVSIIKISDDHNSVAYARALEKIIYGYNKIKEEEARLAATSPINVNHSTIKIDNPNKTRANMYKVGVDITATKKEEKPIIPEIKPTIQPKNIVKTVKAEMPQPENIVKSVRTEMPQPESIVKSAKIEMSQPENTVKSVRMEMPQPTLEKPKEVIKTKEKNQVVIQKIPGNLSLDKIECETYRDQPLVIVTCMSVKNGDGIFRDNIEMLRNNIPNVEIGSFISGKSTNSDQAIKETTRMLKLLDECNVSKLVIYEINNDYITRHLKKKECIEDIVEAADGICDALADANYYPILCMDFDTYENIKTVIPEYQEKYPIIRCVTPKQKDMVTAQDDILYMNPSSDSDALMVSDTNMQTNLKNIPNKIMKESYSQIA